MKADATLLLSRSEVAQLVTILESIEGVEKMFRQLGERESACARDPRSQIGERWSPH